MALENHPRLLDPDTIGGTTWFLRTLGEKKILPHVQSAAEQLDRGAIRMPDVNVVVQALPPLGPRRLARQRQHPEMVLRGIERTLNGIARQTYREGGVKNVVVLVDDTMPIALSRYDQLSEQATLVSLPDSVNRAQALNIGVEAATGKQSSARSSITMLTMAGARYATDQAFRAAARAVTQEGAVGAIGPRLIDKRATMWEGMIPIFGALILMNQAEYREPSFRVGMEAEDNIAWRGGFATEALLDKPFDEAYERGGSGRSWAVDAQSAGLYIAHSPALAVQFAEGLGLFDVVAQRSETMSHRRPQR